MMIFHSRSNVSLPEGIWRQPWMDVLTSKTWLKDKTCHDCACASTTARVHSTCFRRLLLTWHFYFLDCFGPWTCQFLYFVFGMFESTFFVFICFYFAVVCLLPGKMPKKEKQNKKKNNAHGNVRVLRMCSHVCSLFDFPFFPMYFASCFFNF